MNELIIKLEAKTAVARALREALEYSKNSLFQSGIEPSEADEFIAEVVEAWTNDQPIIE